MRRELLRANGHTLTDNGRISATNFRPLNPPVTLGQTSDFRHRYGSGLTSAWEVNDINDPCGCFTPLTPLKKGNQESQRELRADSEAWIRAWPHGIIHSEGVIRSHRATHASRHVQRHSNLTDRHLCLDRSRRDEYGVCDGGIQNTSPSFLAQFAHLAMKTVE